MKKVAYFPIQGGEDLLTPAITVKPGKLLYSKNYECDQQGRPRRIDGFERCSGKPAPSAASYWTLDFDAGTAAISEGDTVTGATSSATGVALIAGVVESGSYAGSNAAGYLVLTAVSGTFVDNENLQVAAATKCVANGTTTSRGADNDTDDTTWYRDAIETARGNISTVPGSGRIRGVWILNNTRYAFRDNAGGTACVMFKEAASGWTAVSLGLKLAFTSGGTVETVEGEVIVGEISGATATVSRVVVTSGTWAGGDAAGYFVFTSDTGTFQAETVKVGASLDRATIAGDSAAITLLPGGRYEFVNYNFFGQAGTLRMYGCDGVNPAFEFDGTVFCPIASRMTTDKPTHIRAHKKHLFLSFSGGSIKHSGIGFPLKWDATSGALEIALGDNCVGMEPQSGGVLALWGRNSTFLLYGSDPTDWDMKNHSSEAGAVEWTIQQMSQALYLDDQGVTSLAAVQEFGDFSGAALSQSVSPVLDEKKPLAISALRVRSKEQYRLFFSDGTGLNFTFRAGKLLGITRLDYGMPVRCCCSVEESGSETLLFGSDDGYVYELDAGTSFDGTEIEALLRTAFNHLKSPENNKTFFKAVIELDAPAGASLQWLEDYGYGTGDLPSAAQQTLSPSSGGGYWNIDNWNEFLWSTQVVATAEAYLGGIGKNIGFLLRSAATYEQPHTIQGITLLYAIRGIAT